MRGDLKPQFYNKYSKLMGLSLLALAGACSGGSGSNSPSLSQLANSNVKVGTDDAKLGEMRIISRAKFEEMLQNGQVVQLNRGGNRDNKLLIGFPKADLNLEHYFGGVVTSTDNKDNTNYGDLKLTDLPPFHVKPVKTTDPQTHQAVLALQGCAENCQPGTVGTDTIMEFPINGTDSKYVYVDFSTVGNDMNLIQMEDPQGQYTHLQGVSAQTVQVSYSNDTLEFDVLGLMQAIPATPQVQNLLAPRQVQAAGTGQQVSFTTRWYLKKRNVNNNFKPQVATNGVGFFMTERYLPNRIEKQETVDATGKPNEVHYFIKDVPEEYKPAFKQAFDDWNVVFQSKIGSPLLSYEFVDATDPLADQLVTGDVRVRVLEWDLNALASYGGLGPSVADQQTGAIITSNVLIQGPTIIQIYTQWFQVNREAQALRDAGQDERADNLLKESRNTLFNEIQSKTQGTKFALALAGKYKFNVNAQDPRLQDATAKLDFEIVPAGVSYDDYMFGYFRDMVGHELGHNMGLRHNFKGSLFATDALGEGGVSKSIMEYLSRPYRYKDSIGEYDLMAIDYGYNFLSPTRTDMYCTDEDKFDINAHTGSAECTPDDATNDPFTQQLARLTRARDLYIAKGTPDAPAWGKADIAPDVELYSNGTLIYAESAQRSMSTWINFFVPAGRPAKDVAAVQSYVLKAVNAVACETGLEDGINSQKPAAAAQLALQNLNDFRQTLQAKITATMGNGFANTITCLQPAQGAGELAGDL